MFSLEPQQHSPAPSNLLCLLHQHCVKKDSVEAWSRTAACWSTPLLISLLHISTCMSSGLTAFPLLHFLCTSWFTNHPPSTLFGLQCSTVPLLKVLLPNQACWSKRMGKCHCQCYNKINSILKKTGVLHDSWEVISKQKYVQFFLLYHLFFSFCVGTPAWAPRKVSTVF